MLQPSRVALTGIIAVFLLIVTVVITGCASSNQVGGSTSTTGNGPDATSIPEPLQDYSVYRWCDGSTLLYEANGDSPSLWGTANSPLCGAPSVPASSPAS